MIMGSMVLGRGKMCLVFAGVPRAQVPFVLRGSHQGTNLRSIASYETHLGEIRVQHWEPIGEQSRAERGDAGHERGEQRPLERA